MSPVTALILLGIAAICGVSGAVLFVLAIVDGSRWLRDRMAMRRIYNVLYNLQVAPMKAGRSVRAVKRFQTSQVHQCRGSSAEAQAR